MAFRHTNTLGNRNDLHFEAISNHGPTVRVPTHRRSVSLPAQGSLPSGGAAPYSGGFRTRWITNWISQMYRHPIPPDQPCLVALVLALPLGVI